ncbi:ATP-binding protein [Zavarzinia compransoris]|uniref:hybrid sensor histidine kinase/response regulator n=1 Tax=Zavarzinia marina TaxID=2911065 RepID=UPI001F2716A2|nr:hybrid sensor histidine kinase/response regulator [Zavarzinia marina]MCF4166175.1 ATP-binding protein [Zavarzinia marina]
MMRRLTLFALLVCALFATHLTITLGDRLETSRTDTVIGASILGDWTARNFEAVDGIIGAAASLLGDRLSPSDLVDALEKRATISPSVIALAVYDAEGRRIASTGRGLILPADLSRADWREPPSTPEAGYPAIGRPVATEDGRTVIPVAHRLAGGELVVGALDPHYFAQVYQSVLRRQTSVVTLVDDRGTVLARTNPRGIAIGDILDGGGIGAIDEGLDGDARFVGEAPLSRLGLTLYLTASRGTSIARWWREEVYFVALFAMILLLMTVGGFAFYRQLRDSENKKQALRVAHRLAEAASVSKSRFLAMMSHELRTPMAGMLGTIDLLRQSTLDRRQGKYLGVLDTSAHALLDVLNDVLDFSKIESEAIVMETVPFDPRETVKSAVDLYRARCEEKSIVLSLVIDDDVPIRLCGDPARLRQILINLVSNAVKFTESGEIHVHVAVRGGDPQVLRFSVRDTGIGMSSTTQHMLFEPFVQADASTSRRFGGTGLGLAICKRLVQAMGGEIGLTSALGNGSRFWFTARFATVPDEVAKTMAAADGGQRRPGEAFAERPRVLVAEDNEINRFLVREQLTRRGFDVVVVENGWRAVEERRRQSFDLVLLDMRMPVMDGPSALAQMREDAGEALPPVVALTADVLSSEVEQYTRAGFDQVMTKPVDWDALEETLLRLHAANRGKSPQKPRLVVTDGRVTLPADLRQLSASDPQFDRREIEELRAVMDESAIDELVASFRATLDVEGAKLHRFTLAGDALQLRETAHAIQGMASQLGAHGIANVARSIRLDGPGALTPAEAASRLDLFDLVVQATLAQIDDLKDRGAA